MLHKNFTRFLLKEGKQTEVVSASRRSLNQAFLSNAFFFLWHQSEKQSTMKPAASTSIPRATFPGSLNILHEAMGEVNMYIHLLYPLEELSGSQKSLLI